MKKPETIAELNEWIIYRLIKVWFILFVISLLIGLPIAAWISSFETRPYKITCLLGNHEVLKSSEIETYISKFGLSKAAKGEYELSIWDDQDIYESCGLNYASTIGRNIKSIYPQYSERTDEAVGQAILDKSYATKAIVSDSARMTYRVEDFYRIEWMVIATLAAIGSFFAVIIGQEILRRIFYYVLIGTFFPQGSTLNEKLSVFWKKHIKATLLLKSCINCGLLFEGSSDNCQKCFLTKKEKNKVAWYYKLGWVTINIISLLAWYLYLLLGGYVWFTVFVIAFIFSIRQLFQLNFFKFYTKSIIVRLLFQPLFLILYSAFFFAEIAFIYYLLFER